MTYSDLAPDWVCEVLSPRTESVDRGKKLTIYARAGVAHAWLVDPQARTLEILRREGEDWQLVAVRRGDEVVRAEPFALLPLELPWLWGASPRL